MIFQANDIAPFFVLDLIDMHTIGSSVLILAMFLALLIKTPKMKLPSQGIPMAADSHWLFGHYHILIGDFQHAWSKIAYERANQDGLCTFWNFSKPTVTVNTVENARLVLASSSSKTALGHFRKHIGAFLGEKSILFFNGKDWKKQRVLYAKALSTKAVLALIDPIRDVTKSLINALTNRIVNENNGQPIEMNMESIIQILLADVSGKVFFGMDFKCCESLQQMPITKSIQFLVDEVSRRITSPLNPAAHFYSLPTAMNRKYKENIQLVRNKLKEVIEERSKQLSSTERSTEVHPDFISTMILDSNAASDSSNVDEVIDKLLTAHMAAFDTSTIPLQYIFYCLACHPEAEEKCLEEIEMAMKNCSNDGGLDIERLVYCNAVFKESLRLYPPVVAMQRKLGNNLKLENVTIPAGMDVFVPFWHIQRDERNFPRALEFLPERWVKRTKDCSWIERDAKEEKELNNMNDDGTIAAGNHGQEGSNQHDALDFNPDIPAGNKDAFLAFSAGGRDCVGYKLAKTEITVVLVELIRHFKFELVPGFKIKPENIAVMQRHIGGIPMIISMRE